MAASVRFELTHERVKVFCLTTWLRGNRMVERGGFEPPNPKEQIYSLSRLASSLSLHNGAENRNRTRNLLITNQLLYQLSYVLFTERLDLNQQHAVPIISKDEPHSRLRDNSINLYCLLTLCIITHLHSFVNSFLDYFINFFR